MAAPDRGPKSAWPSAASGLQACSNAISCSKKLLGPMKIFDPLYGEVQLSAVQTVIARSPEFRRLSHIRLLNSASPTLATLGELRRYSHTLGVAALNLEWRQKNERFWKKEELDALEAAVLLHDIATPPFAHLFEYMLKRHQ